ncbi:D-alanine--D-alanine ligase [Thermodesulfobacterium sp. TA1]|uniref:D-alanine--D-alanine ligase family protein n=1 Tax=Thermodesulfobacterium sp. TA1 TaxID=2234087 RepID=UPI00123280B4|nr:D-alanine--D-alanine ligase [Thermodesulfobacterium sp. TA1]QER41719.1 D-alanine--D-alanine ligase [Thermodesulfobacterium sp. TA1]
MSSRPVLRVALLAGGKSSEREVSLKGAQAVKKALEALGHKYEFFDPATDLFELAKRAKEFDCAFLVMHGPGGEDGTLQGFLDSIGLPYQGAGVLGSALAMHKGIAKELYRLAGLKVPEGQVFTPEDGLEKVKAWAKTLGYPLVVKPATQGSSIGLTIAKQESELPQALEKAYAIDKEVLVEQYLKGREITVGILDEEPLPVVEIVPKASETFDYTTKYTPGLAEEICPAPIGENLTKKAQEYGLKAHKALKIRHYSRTDMIIKDEEIYVLETNTIPGMTETSLLPLAAKVAGYSFEGLIQKLLDLTLKEKF